jgi:hypothetical protein
LMSMSRSRTLGEGRAERGGEEGETRQIGKGRLARNFAREIATNAAGGERAGSRRGRATGRVARGLIEKPPRARVDRVGDDGRDGRPGKVPADREKSGLTRPNLGSVGVSNVPDAMWRSSLRVGAGGDGLVRPRSSHRAPLMEQVRLRARVRLFPRANRPRPRRALARGRVGRRLLHRAMMSAWALLEPRHRDFSGGHDFFRRELVQRRVVVAVGRAGAAVFGTIAPRHCLRRASLRPRCRVVLVETSAS